jgi:hypothetical protein
MITVTGTVSLKVSYSVEFDMTEDEWDSLLPSQQDDLLDSHVDWKEACRDAEVDGFDIDDVKDSAEESA